VEGGRERKWQRERARKGGGADEALFGGESLGFHEEQLFGFPFGSANVRSPSRFLHSVPTEENVGFPRILGRREILTPTTGPRKQDSHTVLVLM